MFRKRSDGRAETVRLDALLPISPRRGGFVTRTVALTAAECTGVTSTAANGYGYGGAGVGAAAIGAAAAGVYHDSGCGYDVYGNWVCTNGY